MTTITIYDTEAERLNEAAAKVGESVATVIEWLVEENLDELVKDVKGEVNDRGLSHKKGAIRDDNR